jgi:hypothetical protein
MAVQLMIPNRLRFTSDQQRHFEFQGKYLTLKGPLLLGGVQWVVSLVWERWP